MNVLKSLNQRGQHNWIKIVCLAVGLATGIVLIGKAGFEQSWDRFFPTSDRIWRCGSRFEALLSAGGGRYPIYRLCLGYAYRDR